MILPPLASSLLLAPGLRKFRTAPVMASASGLFWGGQLPALVPGSCLCEPFMLPTSLALGLYLAYHIILFFTESSQGTRYRRIHFTGGCRFTSKAQVVQTLQNDFQKCSCKRTSPLKESSQELPSPQNGHLAWCAASKILPRSMLFTPTTDTAQPRRAMT